MPCSSEHMEPTRLEIASGRVASLLDEVNGFKFNHRNSDTHHRTYGKSSQEILDKLTDELCTKLNGLSSEEIKQYSLELQIWWRDHQEFDKKRKRQEKIDKKNEEIRKRAINKLTDEELKVLGIKMKASLFNKTKKTTCLFYKNFLCHTMIYNDQIILTNDRRSFNILLSLWKITFDLMTNEQDIKNV